MSQDPDRQLVSQTDLLPRPQLTLRGGIWRPQPIEQVIRQAFAYQVGLGPNGSVLEACDAAGRQYTITAQARIPFVWNSGNIAANGGTAIWTAPVGQVPVVSMAASLTGAQPVNVNVSFDWGVTWSALPAQTLTSLVQSVSLAFGAVANAFMFTNNNATTAAQVQLVGALGVN